MADSCAGGCRGGAAGGVQCRRVCSRRDCVAGGGTGASCRWMSERVLLREGD